MAEGSINDLKDEASLSLNDVSSQVRKLRRRSSIFKLILNGSPINYTFNESKLGSGTDFASNHEKMKHEILNWKNTYVEIKNDYKSYKKSVPKDTVLGSEFAREHIILDNYVTKAKSFIIHVNNIVEMYNHLKQYEAFQLKQMNDLHTHVQKKIQKKVNL